ncbi:hypothetical protein H671_3g11047 [Cricetulus griseus]|nr:hypothetical protein H671_3g11047 [Cricetulus griseus]
MSFALTGRTITTTTITTVITIIPVIIVTTVVVTTVAIIITATITITTVIAIITVTITTTLYLALSFTLGSHMPSWRARTCFSTPFTILCLHIWWVVALRYCKCVLSGVVAESPTKWSNAGTGSPGPGDHREYFGDSNPSNKEVFRDACPLTPGAQEKD